MGLQVTAVPGDPLKNGIGLDQLLATAEVLPSLYDHLVMVQQHSEA